MDRGHRMHGWRRHQGDWGHESFGCHRHQKEKKMKAEWIKEAHDGPIVSFVNAIAQKTWTLKNVGSEEWGDDVKLVFFKGNETLVLEKQYAVPNTKPEESAQVSAAIQIPPVSGRFSACFRLQKNGESFGPRLWVDVDAFDENKTSPDENENRNENDKKNETMSCICVCGVPMIETSPMVAYYDAADVRCDLCGADCPSNGSIFHCFSQESASHPKGYDLCLNCAQSQMQSFQQPQEQKNEEIAQPKEENTAPEEENTSPKAKEENTAPLASDPWNGFEYAIQAHELEEMGFTDFEIIKELLTNKKGNISEVLAVLLQQ